jgi:hypothetical protein
MHCRWQGIPLLAENWLEDWSVMVHGTFSKLRICGTPFIAKARFRAAFIEG